MSPNTNESNQAIYIVNLKDKQRNKIERPNEIIKESGIEIHKEVNEEIKLKEHIKELCNRQGKLLTMR